MIRTSIVGRSCAAFVSVLAAGLVSTARAADTSTSTASAFINFVQQKCGGDWSHIAQNTTKSSFTGSVLNGCYGTAFNLPKITTDHQGYEDYYTGWFHTTYASAGVTYPVDVFSRVQTVDQSKPHQLFLGLRSDLATNTLTWTHYINIAQANSFSNPIWTGQTYDIAGDTTNHLRARWQCGMKYPADGKVRFNAMHELTLRSTDGSTVDGKTQARIQVEVRQSTNQGTSYTPNSYQDPISGDFFYINGFTPNSSYHVWTFTLYKSAYSPSSTYNNTVDLSAFVLYLRAHPNIWSGATFPVNFALKRVETGVEVWYGSDGSEFTSTNASFWRQ